METPLAIDSWPAIRRVIQVVSDLSPGGLSGVRVLDLACAHGSYALDLAKRGASVVGLEGRASWLTHARQTQAAAGITNLEFVQDDVRHLSASRYGDFDTVLCLGILYHLDVPDVFEVVARVAEVCRRLAIVETMVAIAPVEPYAWRGHQYWGVRNVEHPADTTAEAKLAAVSQSLDNERSVQLTLPSLMNLLRHVGFTSVYDCRVPLANLYVGPQRDVRIWTTRVTLAAIKGEPVVIGASDPPPVDWPEQVDDLSMERVLSSGGQTVQHGLKGPQLAGEPDEPGSGD
jgi:SAM-dependent methyltransferase